MIEEVLDGPVVEQDVHEGPVSRVVRAIDPRGVFVVAVAIGGRALAGSTGRRSATDEGALELNGIAAENLVRTGRDAVLRPLDHLDAEGCVKSAAEVVGHREGVVVDAGLIENDVAVVRVEILVDDARPRPVGTVGIESDGGRKGGDARNQGRVQVQAPLEDVAVVDGQVVHDRERPGAVQRAPDKIAEIALRCVDAGIGDVVVLRVARIVRVGRLRPVAVVVDVGGDIGVGRPSIVIARTRNVGPVVHRLTEETTTATIGVTHQRHRGPVGAGDGQIEVAHVTVLHIDRHRQQVVAIVQGGAVLEEIEVEFAGVAESGTVREIGLPGHDLWGKRRPGHTLHGVPVHKGGTACTDRRALETVEQGNGAHQHLQRLKVERDAPVVVQDGEVDDVFPRLIEAVGHVPGIGQGVDGPIVEVPDPVLEVEFRSPRHGPRIAEGDFLVEADPDGQGVRIGQRRVNDAAGRCRSRTGRGAGYVGLPSRGELITRPIVLEYKREASGGVVHRGGDGQSLKGIAGVVAHRGGPGVRTVVDEQVVAVVWIGIGLQTKGHEAHRHGIPGIVRTDRVGEVGIRIRIARPVVRVACVNEDADTGLDGLVPHDEELRGGRGHRSQADHEGQGSANQVLVHAHAKMQRWNFSGIRFVAHSTFRPPDSVRE